MDLVVPRVYPLIEIAPEQLEKAVLAHFSDRQILATRALTQGYHHTNYLIEFEDHPPLILRLHPENSDSLHLEQHLFPKIQTAIPVPKYLIFDETQQILPYSYALIEYISGSTMIDFLLKKGRKSLTPAFFSVGQTLGQLSQFTFAKPGLLNPDLSIKPCSSAYQHNNIYFVHAMDCLLNPHTIERVGFDYAVNLKNFIINQAHYLPETCNYLIHGDFRPENILLDQIDGAWQIHGLLDWEFCASGSFYFDLGTFLNYDYLYFPDELKAFQQGYEQTHGHPLPETWFRSARLVSIINQLEIFTRKPANEVLAEQAKRLINKFMKEW